MFCLKISLKSFLIWALFSPVQALSLTTFKTPLLKLRVPQTQVVFSGALDASSNSGDPVGFNLLRSGAMSVREYTPLLIKQMGLSPLLTVRTSRHSAGLQLLSGEESYSAQLEHQGVPLCFPRLKVFLGFGNKLNMQGQIPQIDAADPGRYDWPDEEQTLMLTEEWGAQHNYFATKATVRRFQRCYLTENGQLVKAARATISSGRLSYKVVATEQRIMAFNPAYFSATGLVKYLSTNPNEGDLKYSQVSNMVGDGTLNSTTFLTDPGTAEPATSCEQRFDYATDDIRFQETNVFAVATETLNYFSKNFGYEWKSQYAHTDSEIAKTEKMMLAIHQAVGEPPTQNNALYQPAEDSPGGIPHIIIGDGDGVGLQNLALDADVVSHEFGHHIVYRSVTEYSADSEALILHEALADFFTFARTDNACLGESICPEGTPFCYLTSCLRSAETSIKWTDVDKPIADHLEGQVISGMLWDLYKNGSIALNVLAGIVYDAIDYLSESATFTGFFAALIQVDSSKHSGAYCSKILEAITNRGFERFIWSLECGASLRGKQAANSAQLALVDESSVATDYIASETTDEALAATLATTNSCPESPSVSGDVTKLPCGVITPSDSTPNLPWANLLLLLLPFLGLIFARIMKLSSSNVQR